MINDHVILQPYDIEYHILVTENKTEDNDAENLFNKHSSPIGVKTPFGDEDTRPWASAFSHGINKNKKLVCILYIRNKRINELTLDHELIHCLNWINEHFAISVKYLEDEAVAVFFEYLKKETLKLLKRNCIKVTRVKL